jgi:deoxyribodipyrimidine photo-lyase
MAPRQAAFIVSHLHSLQAALAKRDPAAVEQAEISPPAWRCSPAFAGSGRSPICFTTTSTKFNERQRDAAVEKTLRR